MDTRKIRKLIELVKETGIGELEVKSGEESVRINCQTTVSNATQYAAPTPTEQSIPEALPSSTPRPDSPKESLPAAAPVKKPARTSNEHTVKSPMVGTVYLAPAPGSPPFVKSGQSVKVGDTLCMVEAMKMFNKIEADKAGIISARLIENEQPVEYDQPLFIIDVAGA